MRMRTESRSATIVVSQPVESTMLVATWSDAQDVASSLSVASVLTRSDASASDPAGFKLRASVDCTPEITAIAP